MIPKLFDVIEGLVNSEDDTGCNGGHTVVEKRWVLKLKEYVKAEYKAEAERNRRKELEGKRRDVADMKYGLASNRLLNIPKESEVLESEGWETDGEDRLIQKFYYSNPEGGDSLIGSFIVDFKPNSAKVIDVHSNT